MPLVSVIIVNFNSGDLLLESVQRVLRSTVPVEVFVSDNGSSDDSIAKLYAALPDCPNLHVLENRANLGFSKGNNLAVPQTSGECLLFLNPDCLIEPDTIERCLNALLNNPKSGMAGCLIVNADGSEQTGCRRNIPKPWQSLSRVFRLNRLFPGNPLFHDFNLTGTQLPDKPVPVEAISGAYMLVKRDALQKVGLLDPDYFLHCEDLDWCMRFALAGYDILFIPDVRITHVQGSCSASRRVFVEWHKHRGMMRFYRKFFASQYPKPFMWLVLAAIWLRFGLLAAYLTGRRLAVSLRGARRG